MCLLCHSIEICQWRIDRMKLDCISYTLEHSILVHTVLVNVTFVACLRCRWPVVLAVLHVACAVVPARHARAQVLRELLMLHCCSEEQLLLVLWWRRKLENSWKRYCIEPYQLQVFTCSSVQRYKTYFSHKCQLSVPVWNWEQMDCETRIGFLWIPVFGIGGAKLSVAWAVCRTISYSELY